MRKVILHVALTLDGFIEGPNGELDWLVRDETIDFADILDEILSDKDAIFYGRVSYEKWGNFTPDGAGEKLRAAYERMHSLQKYVFTNTTTFDGVEVVSGDTSQAVNEIKSRDGKAIWLYGGRHLVSSFLDLGLIDEYKLAVHPVIIGRGVPLFENLNEQHRLTLINAKPHPSGVTLLHYRNADRPG